MINKIKTAFGIKDLENLTGIKTHTIRIWEKRYNLLRPNRSDTNIRSYNISDIQKMLNISYLNKNGYKISKIAKLKDEEISVLTKEIINAKDEGKVDAINTFKLSMLNFDQSLFTNTYNPPLALVCNECRYSLANPAAARLTRDDNSEKNKNEIKLD